MYYLVTFGGIHENFWQENLKTIGGIHETRLKKKLSFSGARSTPALEPSRSPEKFQFIFLPSFMKPPMVSNFLPKKFS